LTSTGTVDHITKQKRSTIDLEYVMRVLVEQGRLCEVDGDLLSKIQTTISKDKGQRNIQRKSKQASSQRESVLSLARARQQQLFGIRSQNRFPLPEPRRNSLLSERKQASGGECQALQTENNILKQQLLVVQSQKQQQEPRRNAKLLNSIQVK
jgi:hypothetical protein